MQSFVLRICVSNFPGDRLFKKERPPKLWRVHNPDD
ncbi:hypothetical protein FBY06_103162 [Pseudomonas sp. SJZ085]|nr:hypothetical protein FBX99_102213 [Pseudomonas sp. SJZ074]TWC40980.1 hypothetical protein FBY06_103162 [Pseudomonas sp. SJZ085]